MRRSMTMKWGAAPPLHRCSPLACNLCVRMHDCTRPRSLSASLVHAALLCPSGALLIFHSTPPSFLQVHAAAEAAREKFGAETKYGGFLPNFMACAPPRIQDARIQPRNRPRYFLSDLYSYPRINLAWMIVAPLSI